MILFLSPDQRTRWNPGHQYFRDSISGVAEVKYMGPNIEGWSPSLNELGNAVAACGTEPTCIMTYGLRYTIPFSGLGATSIPKVHFVCDLLPPIAGTGYGGTEQDYRALIERDKYDYFLVMTTRAGSVLINKFGIDADRIGFLPHGVETTRFNIPVENRTIDVSTGWSINDLIYPNRRAINDRLEKSDFKDVLSVQTGKVYNEKFQRRLNQSKIVVNSVDRWKTLNMKFFEVMASGALLVTDHSPDADRVGLKRYEHYVPYDSVDNLVSQLRFYLANDHSRKKIAEHGQKEVLHHHSNSVRAHQLIAHLRHWGVPV